MGIDPESCKKGSRSSLLSSPQLQHRHCNIKEPGRSIMYSHLMPAAIFLYHALRPRPCSLCIYNIFIPFLESCLYRHATCIYSLSHLKSKFNLFSKRFVGSQSVMCILLLHSSGWFGPQVILISARFVTTSYSKS